MGRSPKTEGASGRIVNSQDRGGTSPGGVRFPVPTRRKAPVKSVWGIDTTSKYQPIRKPPAYPPLAPSVTCGDSSLPERAMGCIPFHIGLCLWKVPAVQSLSHASGVPAPFDKGAFGCTTDTGRVREVTNCRKPPCALTAAARRPFDKGAFGCSIDTGHWRGSNDLLKIPVGNCHRGHPGDRKVKRARWGSFYLFSSLEVLFPRPASQQRAPRIR